MKNIPTKFLFFVCILYFGIYSTNTLAQKNTNVLVPKKEAKKYLNELTQKANSGDITAIGDLAATYVPYERYYYHKYNIASYKTKFVSSLTNDWIALKWAIKGAKLNDSRCTYLAGLYAKSVCGWNTERGQAGLRDSIKYFYKKAADMGYVPAMMELGDLYFDHNELNNEGEAMKWYAMAAENKYAPAIKKINEIIMSKGNPVQVGDEAYARRDYEAAANAYRVGAEFKKDPIAMYKLGMMGKRNEAKQSIAWIFLFSNACDLNYGPACYESGIQNYENPYGLNAIAKTIEYFEKGASLQDEGCKQMLAKIKEIQQANSREMDTRTTVSEKETPEQHKKTCPICNGSGKSVSTYTSEKRDWDNKTITMTDHKTTSACSRCNGGGYITY
ncbi:MAG: hypothetical protein V4548_00475 [Bacteroidota bacterium]